MRTLFPVDTATPLLINDDFSDAHLALRDAIQQQDTAALTALLTSDALEALEVNQADRYGVALLHYAADRGDSATIQALIAAGADMNVADGSSHWTPLMYAVANGHEAAVQAQDATQSTALHVAMFLNHRAIQQWLIDAGANEDAENELGHTPKMLAQAGRVYRARQYGKLGQP